MQIIYAAKLWFWIEASDNRRAEPARGSIPIKPVNVGVFIAYFPAWLKYHELYRLGAYGHPYDFIRANYAKNLNSSQDYRIRGTGWEKRFAMLKGSGKEPFAFLTPAMQNGSALGGTFLPTNGFTLTEIHEMMHLGSIWSIGHPTMPATLARVNGKKAYYMCLAFPDHWYKEVYYNSEINDRFSHRFGLCDLQMTVTLLETEIVEYSEETSGHRIDQSQGIVRIGARMGSHFNPGWTAQLPAKDNNIICVGDESHRALILTDGAVSLMRDKYPRGQIFTDAAILLQAGFQHQIDGQIDFGSLPLLSSSLNPKDYVEWPQSPPRISNFAARPSRSTTGTEPGQDHDSDVAGSAPEVLNSPQLSAQKSYLQVGLDMLEALIWASRRKLTDTRREAVGDSMMTHNVEEAKKALEKALGDFQETEDCLVEIRDYTGSATEIVRDQERLWFLEEEVRRLRADYISSFEAAAATTDEKEDVKIKHQQEIYELRNELVYTKRELSQSKSRLAFLRETFNILEGGGDASSDSC
jgi:hypothetical protein